MLIAKIYINYDQIDEIHIQNLGTTTANNRYHYKIRKPEGFETTIIHNRDDGYNPLLQKVLKLIRRNK